MSTIKSTHLQHPSSLDPNITLSSDGTTSIPGLSLDTDQISEGQTNLYYTDERVGQKISEIDTDDVNEGEQNLYFTDDRATTSALSVAVDKTGDEMSGVLKATNYYIGMGTADSDNINIDFENPVGFLSRGVTGNIVFSGANYVQGGIKSVRLVNGGSLRNVSFPAAWVFVGVKPTTIAANKTAIFTITSFGSSEGECVASWAVEF